MRPTLLRTMCGALTCILVPSCSGPQPLSVAIRPEDERAYLAAMVDHPASAKAAYFSSKVNTDRKPLAEVVSSDARISTTKNPFDSRHDLGAVSKGAVIFKAHCMRCHGEDARGGGPDLLAGHPCKDFHAFDQRFAVTLHGGAPRAWFRKISEGSGPTVQYPDGRSRAMPAFGDVLAREQIWLAITYLQSLDAYAAPPQNAVR